MPPRYRVAYATLLDYCRSHSRFTVNDFKAWCKENELELTPERIMEFAHVDTKVDSPERTWDQMDTMYKAAWTLLLCQQAQECVAAALAAPSFADVVAARQNFIERTMEIPKTSILEQDEFEAGVRVEVDETVSIDEENSRYLSTGYYLIDEHILGYRRGGVTLFAAHSGVGKTWFAVDSSFLVVTKSKKRVLFVSSEMEPKSIATRYFSVLNNISLSRESLKAKKLDGSIELAYKNLVVLTNKDVYLRILGNTGQGLSIDDIEAEVLNCSAVKPLDLIVVDYLQNITNDHLRADAPTYERNKDTMLRLDLLAKTYNCAVLALVQLNNPNRKQGTAAPGLYDIAESSYIVQPANAVLMMYKVSEPEQSDIKELRLAITKSRYGTCTDSPLKVTRSAGGAFAFSE